jgi:hypothetical protein
MAIVKYRHNVQFFTNLSLTHERYMRFFFSFSDNILDSLSKIRIGSVSESFLSEFSQSLFYADLLRAIITLKRLKIEISKKGQKSKQL